MRTGVRTLELAHVEIVVEAFLAYQFLMRTALDDPVIIDYQHQIGVANCAQAVRNDKRGTPLQQAQQSLLNLQFGASIDAAGGFVQNQDAGICQYGAGNRQQLPLALAEIMALLGYLGVVGTW